MSGEESEEKTLQPTNRKLRKQREKGSVVTSREAVMSVTGVASLTYLYSSRFRISEKLGALWELEPAPGQTFALQLQSKMVIVGQLGIEVVLPLLGLVIGIGILAGMLVAGGPVFSLEPLMPKFEKINPAAGFKRLFSRRAMMSFLMSVIRLVVLLVVFALVLLSSWSALILAPVCGLGCAVETWEGVLFPLVVGAVAVMAFMAMFDYLVQRAEFIREQMMTLSEYKREMKDMSGDPHLRGHLKKERKSMLTTSTGPAFATIMVSDGNKLSIGVRYVAGETPAPLVVAKARGAKAIRQMASKSKAFEQQDSDLVALISRIAVGSYITDDEMIARIAPILHQAG